MKIVPVSTVLSSKRLSEPVLNALIPNVDNYKVLLMQPRGYIEVNAGVRNHDRNLALRQFNRFLAHAKETEADLVVTPEYSMPWESLIDAIKTGNGPKEGKVWALGCESITYADLKKLKKLLSLSAEMLFEKLPSDPGRFVSPLAYVFLAPDVSGENAPRTVILVQFKTCPMGDKDHFEVDGLQKGTIIYQFGGTDRKIRLISLICSDIFEFKDEDAERIYKEALILHIQLNKNPRHELFQGCRSRLLGYDGDETEILCLNWAANIELQSDGVSIPWYNIAGSAWYLKSDDFDARDKTLCANHRRGLYYTRLQSHRAHALFFNYLPAVYLIAASKVAHFGVPGAGAPRRGPQLMKIFTWNALTDDWTEQAVAEDGFLDVVGDSGPGKQELLNIAARNPFEAERVLALSAGSIGRKEEWHDPQYMDSCIIGSAEIIRRITFAQDTNLEAQGFRTARLKRFGHLWDILSDAKQLPPALTDFKRGFSFGWSPVHSHQNAVSTKDKYATVIYMGEEANSDQIETVYTIAAELLHRGFSDPKDSHEARQRLVVWFRGHDDKIHIFGRYRFLGYTSTNDKSEYDIGRAE